MYLYILYICNWFSGASSLTPPHPALTAQLILGRLDDVYQTWLANLNQSFAALKAQVENQSLPLATRDRGGTSVVVLPGAELVSPKVVLVQWRDCEAMTGHIVDVDAKGLLIAVVHVGEKRYPRDYSRCRVLVKQTGVTYTRARRVGFLAEKNELPSHWRWLMRMWTTAFKREVELQLNEVDRNQEEGGSSSNSSSIECACCSSSTHTTTNPPPERELNEGNGGGGRGGGDNNAARVRNYCLTCPLCLLATHGQCASELAQKLKAAHQHHATGKISVSLPDTYDGVLPKEIGETLGWFALLVC